MIRLPETMTDPWRFDPVTGTISDATGPLIVLTDIDPSNLDYLATGYAMAALPEFMRAALTLRKIYLSGGDCDEAIEAMFLLNAALNKAGAA